MSQGTITPNLFDRLALTFGRALKAAPPNPGLLYPPTRSGASYPISFPGWDEWYQHYGSDAGKRDEATAKTAITFPPIYRDINAIAMETSTSTVVVKRRATSEDDQDVINHEFERLWEAPNPFMGRSFLMQFWTWQLILSGEAYLYMRPVAGQLAEIWPIPSWMIEPIPDKDAFIKAYAFKVSADRAPMRIDPRFICYSRLPHPFDPRRGLSPLVALMTDVEAGLAMSRWNRAFFAKENATPEGLIAMPRDSLDEDVIRVRQELADFYSGGTRRVAVARAGDLAWTAFGRSQKDMEFLGGLDHIEKMVSTTLGIPEGYWAKEASRANSGGAKATFIEGAVWPKLVMLAEDLNAQTMPLWYGSEDRATFDDIRPRNRAADLADFTAHSSVLLVNELRTSIGQKPLPDDDPRGGMLIAEIGKGTPIVATPSSALTEDALAAQEAAAGLGAAETMQSDAAPTPDEMLPEPPEEAVKAAERRLPWHPDTVAMMKDDAPLPSWSELDRQHAQAAERRAWMRKALKRGADVRFAVEHLSDDEADAIRSALSTAQDAAAIKAAFSAPVEALIDSEWNAALEWARKAMEG